MKSFNSLSNEVSSLSAETIQARAHSFSSGVSRFGKWNSSAIPTISRIGYPSTLSASRSNPYAGLSILVNNSERPLGLKIEHIAVRNQNLVKGIHHLNNIISKDELGSNPNYVSNPTQRKRNCQLENVLHGIGNDHEAISGEEKNKYERGTRPYKIASGSKGFRHMPSIAGDRK